MLTSTYDTFVIIFLKISKGNLLYLIHFLKPHTNFSDQTCRLLDMKCDSNGWTTLTKSYSLQT